MRPEPFPRPLWRWEWRPGWLVWPVQRRVISSRTRPAIADKFRCDKAQRVQQYRGGTLLYSA